MTHLSGRIEAKPNGRLFEPLWQIQQLLACIMQAGISLHMPGERPAVGDFLALSKQFKKSAIMQLEGVVALSFRDQMPLSTWIDFQEVPGFTFEHEHSFGRLENLAISIVFVSFYQKYNDWLHDNVSKSSSDWPEALQFARLVRNAMAHDGCINIPKGRAVGAKWHHLVYGKADHGTRIVGPVLASGDLLILLVEASQELDRLKA